MDRLTIKEIRPFIEHFLPGILGKGLIPSLLEFADKTSGPAGRAARSWHDAMLAGSSMQDSLRFMSPGFPLCVEELFILAAEQGVLDQALSDMLKAFGKKDREEDLLDELSLLAGRYRDNPSGEFIGEECFQKELDRIIRLAELEKAAEVMLEQEGERFLHLKYIAARLVRVTQPCHSKTYRTILKRLDDSSGTGAPLDLSGRSFSVRKKGAGSFNLAREGLSLDLTFK